MKSHYKRLGYQVMQTLMENVTTLSLVSTISYTPTWHIYYTTHTFFRHVKLFFRLLSERKKAQIAIPTKAAIEPCLSSIKIYGYHIRICICSAQLWVVYTIHFAKKNWSIKSTREIICFDSWTINLTFCCYNEPKTALACSQTERASERDDNDFGLVEKLYVHSFFCENAQTILRLNKFAMSENRYYLRTSCTNTLEHKGTKVMGEKKCLTSSYIRFLIASFIHHTVNRAFPEEVNLQEQLHSALNIKIGIRTWD